MDHAQHTVTLSVMVETSKTEARITKFHPSVEGSDTLSVGDGLSNLQVGLDTIRRQVAEGKVSEDAALSTDDGDTETISIQ